MADILFKRPDGSFAYVDSSEAESALADGYVPSTPEALAASKQTGQAALEGAARGFTMGFGENLVKNLESEFTGRPVEEIAREMKLRQEENPVASTVGEVGGAVGSMFLGPGALVAEGAGAVRGATLASKAAAGAIEGGVWGLGGVVSEAALDDVELTAEKVAAGMAAGALTGGTLDVVGHGVGKGVSGLVKKFGGTTIGDALKKKADDISLSMIESKKWARKYGIFEEDILRVARDEGVLTRGTALTDEAVAAAEAAKERTWEQMRQQFDTAQYFNPPDYQSIATEVADSLKKHSRKATPEVQNAIAGVADDLVAYANQKSTYAELWDLESMWRRRVDRGSDTPANDVLHDARIALRERIIKDAPKQIETAGGTVDLGRSLGELNKRYAALNAFSEGLADATQGLKSRGNFGFKEVFGAAGVGSMVGGVPGIAAAAGTAAAGKFLRARGGFMVGETLRELADSNATSMVGKALQRRVQQALSTAPELLGGFRGVLESAAAQGADALLDTHVQLASSARGPEYLATLGLEPDSAEQVGATGMKLAYLSAAQQAAGEYDLTLASAADGLLGAARGRPGSLKTPTLTAKDYEKFRGSLQTLLRDPEGAFTKVPSEMYGSLPQVSGLTAATIMRGAQFLDSKAPKSPYEGMPASVAPRWEPSQADLDRFNRYKEAVENPAKALQNMAHGYLAPEQVEAMKAVYPRLYSDLQMRLGERLAELKKPLTYQQKMALSLVMGPTALGMSPQQIQVLQATQGSAGAAGSGMKKPDGRQGVDAQKNAETQGQRMEAR